MSFPVQALLLAGILSSGEVYGYGTHILEETRSFRDSPGVRHTAGSLPAREVVSVDFEIARGDRGVLIVSGSAAEAFALYVKDGHVVYLYQHILDRWPVVLTSRRINRGNAKVRFEFDPRSRTDFSRRGNGRLWVNGTEVGAITPETVPCSRCAMDTSVLQLTFTGRITRVAFE